MASFNKVILIGNLTRDPEVKYIASGTATCDVGLAVNHTYKDKQGNKKEEVTFVDVTLWGRTAEIAGEYLTKGRPVLIEGRLKLDQWDDKETGQKRSKLKVIGENMTMLGSRGAQDQRPESDNYGEEPQAASSAPVSAFDDAGDVPF